MTADAAPTLHLRVLLLSPVEGVDVQCGDTTYTATLLDHPAPGVEYVAYPDAIAVGDLVELDRRRRNPRAFRTRRRREFPAVAFTALLNRLRGRGPLFREPVRLFAVRPGAFDAIHLHVVSAAFYGPCPPIVASAASSLPYLYRHAFGWRGLRLQIAERIERVLAAVLRGNAPLSHFTNVSRLVCYSLEEARMYPVARHFLATDRLDVISLPVDTTNLTRSPAADAVNFGFIAKDFEARGGPMILDAFEICRRTLGPARLSVVGSEAGDERANVLWMGQIERARLLTDVLPGIDIAVWASRLNGISYSLAEAAGSGCALVLPAHPPLIEEFGTEAAEWFEPGSVDDLARAMTSAAVPARRQELSERAVAVFRLRFAADAVARQLQASYLRAVTESAQR